MLTNATIEQLNEALTKVNAKYDGNIAFNTLEQKTKNVVTFTLSAKSKKKGARKAASGRNLPKASWHVHGYLFDVLFALNPTCYIRSMGRKITKGKGNGNWVDSIVAIYPREIKMSELSIL